MAFTVKAEHQNEILKYMKYFNLKKEEFLKERQRDLKDFLTDTLNEGDNIFNKDDVENLFQKYMLENLKYCDKDLSLLVHLSSSYLQSVLFEAEQQNIELHVDINIIENNQVIEQLKMLEKQGSNINDITKSFTKKVSKLPSIGAGYNNDPMLLQRINELEKELEGFKKKNQNLQQEVISMVKDKKPINDQNFDDFSIKTEGTYKNELGALENQLKKNIQENEELAKKLQILAEEQNKKLSESVQVNNLKKMIQMKNEQVKTLKSRLTKYEKVEEID